MEPWLSKLSEGDSQSAWDLFAERYRQLILATIRRLVSGRDDVMDVFSMVCQELTANDFARLRRYSDQSARAARVSTWLVAVVRNLTVDWLRQRDGRRRLSIPPELSKLQQQIYAAVCIEGHSYVEAYELLCGRTESPIAFHEFLREVTATHRIAPCPGGLRHPRRGFDPLSAETAIPAIDPAQGAELALRIGAALASAPADVRLAVELVVVERMAAAEVALVVGWPNAKAVYNRVYRALSALRAEFERQGIRRGDL